MSPQKKHPRPKTAWCGWSRMGNTVWITPASRVSTCREHIRRDKAANDSGAVRVRITPIRKPTDAEIERLAQALYEACGRAAFEFQWKSITRESVRRAWLDAARLAWKRGAR